jgi:sugar transferase EpsL
MIKRLFDIVVSFIVLIFLFPIILVIAAFVLFYQGWPIIFKQLRPGYLGIPFNIYKFRTMNDVRDINGALLPDYKRLMKFGKFLRASSLDELPALWNVIKGDMSLVGPRPLLMEYLPLYDQKQIRRHEVKPGITGWAQINGRNAISWQEKFELDVWYVDHISLWLDVKILLITVKKVLLREGIAENGHVTISKFTGNTK